MSDTPTSGRIIPAADDVDYIAKRLKELAKEREDALKIGGDDPNKPMAQIPGGYSSAGYCC